jgi:PREDICTED: endothelin converting enzyme 1-like, partial
LNASKVKTKTLADILGLEMAYEAYKYVADVNGEEKPLPGLSIHNDQLFFLSFAQVKWFFIIFYYLKTHYRK